MASDALYSLPLVQFMTTNYHDMLCSKWIHSKSARHLHETFFINAAQNILKVMEIQDLKISLCSSTLEMRSTCNYVLDATFRNHKSSNQET